MRTADHPLVETYLAAVARETAGLSASRRNELLADLREHIDIALEEESAPGDKGLRAVLARLGDPRTIAATATEDEPAAEPGSRRRTVLPLVLLSAAMPIAMASSLPGAMVLAAGMVLLWNAPQWQTREKATTTAAVLAAPVLIMLTALCGPSARYAWTSA